MKAGRQRAKREAMNANGSEKERNHCVEMREMVSNAWKLSFQLLENVDATSSSRSAVRMQLEKIDKIMNDKMIFVAEARGLGMQISNAWNYFFQTLEKITD